MNDKTTQDIVTEIRHHALTPDDGAVMIAAGKLRRAADEIERLRLPSAAPEVVEAVRDFVAGTPPEWPDNTVVCMHVPEGFDEPPGADEPSPLTLGHLRAISAIVQSSPAGGGWNFDMEAAPKDGTVVQLADDNGNVHAGWWTTDKRYPWAFIDDTRFSDEHAGDVIIPNAWPADHSPIAWQHFPAPPAAPSKEVV